MRKRDPIASATLARLYMAQGHWARARSILADVLARNPFDGDARALQSRLGAGRRLVARLHGDATPPAVELRWQGIDHASDMYLVIVMVEQYGQTRVTSELCTTAFGTHRMLIPASTVAITAAVGRVEPHLGFAPVAVLPDPLAWDPGA